MRNSSSIAQKKIISFCGHPHLKNNSNNGLKWWRDRKEVTKDFKAGTHINSQGKVPFPVNLACFKRDVITDAGKKVLRQSLDGYFYSSEIPGRHRSLMNIPQVDAMISKFSQKCIAHDQNKEPQWVS